ncbi:MAG TPA: hypothetical protein QGH92_00740 [Candidatus Parcubacteria bacterium]|nr:hypothetical protein [Parcubacteria group bacterium]HJN62116.1 hypothetical protein [Candidatus Parcubacteria bacterium]|tara:strand:+ start:1300 stop:2391 length:1092 start_codon:yes stop_codon:yes gene_type:complete
MIKRNRTILFIILFFLFLSAAPLTIFYSQGYRFDFQEKRFVQTGGLYFKVRPLGAEIYLNGKLVKDTSILFGTALVENLLPKTYDVEIKKEGFHSWQKNLEVKEKLVAEAKNIVLIPKEPEFSLLEENIEDFWFSDDGEKLVYKKFGEEKEKLESVKIPQVIKKDLISHIVVSNSILWLNNQGFLSKSDLTGKTLEIFNTKPLSIKEEKEYKIVVKNSSKIFIQEDNSLFYLNEESKIFEKISDSVKNLKFSPDFKKVVYFNNYEIWVYFLESEEGQPHREDKEKLFLNRFSQSLGNVFWLSNHYLIFNLEDKIKVAEIDNREKLNIVDIAEFQNPKIFFHQKDKKLYVLTKGNLYISEVLLK